MLYEVRKKREEVGGLGKGIKGWKFRAYESYKEEDRTM